MRCTYLFVTRIDFPERVACGKWEMGSEFERRKFREGGSFPEMGIYCNWTGGTEHILGVI